MKDKITLLENITDCLDIYGEKLYIGDEVIPILPIALLKGVEGVITDIRYCVDGSYITIGDKYGQILLKDVDSSQYTTKKRRDEIEKQGYTYYLCFSDNKANVITNLPLTGINSSNFKIPKQTCYVTLCAQHYEGFENEDIIRIKKLYYFASKKDVKVKYSFNHNSDVIVTNYLYVCIEKYKLVKNFELLEKFIQNLILYFNSIDLSKINNKEYFDWNIEKSTFEETLISSIPKIKSKTIK